MPQLTALSAAPRLFSTGGPYGLVTIMTSPTMVVVDVQANNLPASGEQRTDHALLRLSVVEAEMLRDVLGAGIDQARSAALDVRQAGLWESVPAVRAI